MARWCASSKYGDGADDGSLSAVRTDSRAAREGPPVRGHGGRGQQVRDHPQDRLPGGTYQEGRGRRHHQGTRPGPPDRGNSRASHPGQPARDRLLGEGQVPPAREQQGREGTGTARQGRLSGVTGGAACRVPHPGAAMGWKGQGNSPPRAA